MARGSKPGERRGGRKRGQPNKVTANAKQAIELAFDGAGGVPAFIVWAKAFPTEFYTRVYPRILPKELEHSTSESFAALIVAAFGK